MQATYNLVVLFITSLLSLHCNAEDGNDLSVSVVADYDPPSSFPFEPPSYRAVSALTLSCEVEGAEDSLGLIYQWTSTCSGNCFTQGEDTHTVSTPYLHSYDTGVHSCMVYDALGCTGNANITVNVVGAGVYVQTGDRVLPNNSLITTNPRNTIPSFRCLSGSSRSSVGNLIGPQGTDITFSSSDPFNVIRGSSRDPGTLLVFSRRPLELEDTGIYTYRTPDESGHIVEFHFGVYLSSYASAPYCPTIEYTLADIHTLSCVSYGTPPTQVIWERDGERIYFNTTSYHSNQILLNRTSSAYNNTLTINATIDDVIGEYSCTVMNSVGNSSSLTRNIEALEVRGHETPILVGLARIINCSTHLEVTRMERLLRDVGNSAVREREDGGQNLELPLMLDNVWLDGAEFTCSVTTARGKTFSETITIEVRVNRERPTTQPSPMTTPTPQPPASICPENPTQQPSLALGGGLGALSVILAILLVGVAIGWAWSCRRRTGAKELVIGTSQNPSYTATAQADQVPPVQYNTIAQVWGGESEGEPVYEEVTVQPAATPSAREETTDTEYY